MFSYNDENTLWTELLFTRGLNPDDINETPSVKRLIANRVFYRGDFINEFLAGKKLSWVCNAPQVNLEKK